MSSLQENWRKGQNRFCLEVRGGAVRGKMAQTMYAHMNNELKKKRKKTIFSSGLG
jgi:hypothetical protein